MGSANECRGGGGGGVGSEGVRRGHPFFQQL